MIITINIKFCTINPLGYGYNNKYKIFVLLTPWDMVITINIKFCTINPLGYGYNNKYKILYY